MSKPIKSLGEAIDLALGSRDLTRSASFKFDVEGETWIVYEVSISHRDILCFCDRGTATFLVDSYGERNVAELFDWNEETENE